MPTPITKPSHLFKAIRSTVNRGFGYTLITGMIFHESDNTSLWTPMELIYYLYWTRSKGPVLLGRGASHAIGMSDRLHRAVDDALRNRPGHDARMRVELMEACDLEGF